MTSPVGNLNLVKMYAILLFDVQASPVSNLSLNLFPRCDIFMVLSLGARVFPVKSSCSQLNIKNELTQIVSSTKYLEINIP